MQVNLTDFEAKVVRTALMEYALNLQLLAPPKLENEPSTPVYPNPANTHRSSMFLVMDVALWDQASLFWNTKVLDIRRNRLEHTVHGVPYEYHIYDRELLYRYDRVAIRYEEADPSRVMLFAVGADDVVTDFFITELVETTPITMYGPDADKSRLAGRMEKIKQFEQAKQDDLQAMVQGAAVDKEAHATTNQVCAANGAT